MKWLKYQVLALLIASIVQAQMPHEVLLLVNKRSQDSLHVANFYAVARGIPARNIVYLDIPESAYGGWAEVSWEDFTKLIWEPATRAARERGLEEQILAWIYSADFPIRVKTHSRDRQQVSLLGMTFLRNKTIPPGTAIEKGTYRSKLFGGPNSDFKLRLPPLSLGKIKNGLGSNASVPPEAEWLRDGLGNQMPLPCMMLGYTGENGNSKLEVLQCLTRGRISDYRGRSDGIWFVTTDDVRSKCRAWQYPDAVKEMERWNVHAVITNSFPAGAENVMGLMMGAATAPTTQIKSFAPGAMAEHLTSWSAEFQKPQTKVTDWIRAGAALSAGAVVEPLSNPNKFPSARFFCFYAAGCTALESFYQSIACPLQLLLLGDPLAKPYAMPIDLKLLGANRLTGDFTYIAQATSKARNAVFSYAFLLDGKMIRDFDEDPTVRIHLINIADGYHELTAVAKVQHRVEFSAFARKAFVVDRLNRSIELFPVSGKTDGSLRHAMGIKVGGEEKPVRVRLMCGLRVLDEQPYKPDVKLFFAEKDIGEGPNRLQATAVYEDGMTVWSRPLNIRVQFNEEKKNS